MWLHVQVHIYVRMRWQRAGGGPVAGEDATALRASQCGIPQTASVGRGTVASVP